MSWRGLLHLGFALGCVLIVISLLLPSVSHCDWPKLRRIQCVNNLRQIQLAIASYEQKHGVFPPAYVADASGRRLHSWRVLILPFLEQSDLYDQYNFNEPWDGPHNIRLLDEMPGLFQCPEQNPYLVGGTSYVAITGPGTMFPGAATVRDADVKDGLAGTISVVEVANLPIPWTAPLDLDVRTMSFEINAPRRPAIGSRHPGSGANVAMGDSRGRFLKEGISAQVLRALITIDGGELIVTEDP